MPDRIPGSSPRLRLLGRVLVVAGLVLASLLAGGPAMAGGPTSVLLVSEAGRASALHTSDARYQRLSDLLAATSPPPASMQRESAPSGSPDTAPAVTATWLRHNVAVWRIDHVFLDRPEGPWVWREEVGHDEANTDPAHGTWHRPEDPAGLLALLGEMHVLDGQAGTGQADPAQAGVQPAGVQPAGGQPAGGQPAGGQPAGGQPAGGQQAGGQPAGGQPAGGQPAADDPAPGTGGGSGPASGSTGGPWWDGWWWAAAGSVVGGAVTLLGLRTLPAARRWVLAAPRATSRSPLAGERA